MKDLIKKGIALVDSPDQVSDTVYKIYKDYANSTVTGQRSQYEIQGLLKVMVAIESTTTLNNKERIKAITQYLLGIN